MNDFSIAVIIPVFNVEKYLEQTLQSVKNQTLLPDEIIIVDDGSTDNSCNILEKYKRMQNIKIIRTHNRGLGPARNLGRNTANSEYIYFLDSDDLIKKDLFFTIKSTVKKFNKPDMILFSGDAFSDSKKISKKINLKFTLSGKYTHVSGLISQLIKKKEALPQASRYVTKATLWSKNNIYYPATIFEDEAVFFPLLALSRNTIILDKVFFMYRMDREGSITNSFLDKKYALSYLHIINLFINFMNKYPELTKLDYSAWKFRLGRIGLNYISMCIKTNSSINWVIIYKLMCKVKSILYLFKLLFRIIKYIKFN